MPQKLQSDETQARTAYEHDRSFRRPKASQPRRILLADDDDDIRTVLEELLQRFGYDVYTVENGGELLDYLTAWILEDTAEIPAELIVTDIRMPGFDGLNILEGLRARGFDVPVIVMSAFGDDAVRERVARLGAATFLAKPFDPIAVERAIEELTRES